MKEEQYLKEKLGKENPFRVPDGYFDSLTSQVMARVDAEQKQQAGPKARTVWLRPVLYAAASVCALFVSVVAYHNYSGSPVSAPVQQVAERLRVGEASAEGIRLRVGEASAEGIRLRVGEASAEGISQVSDNSFDDALDYAMVDNQDIYACLSSDY